MNRLWRAGESIRFRIERSATSSIGIISLQHPSGVARRALRNSSGHTWTGEYYVVFFIEVGSRRVSLGGPRATRRKRRTQKPGAPWKSLPIFPDIAPAP